MQILRRADARVGLNGSARAGFPGSAGVAVAAPARAGAAIEGVVAAELVAHLVRHVVDIERVADGGARAGQAARFLVADAHHAQARYAAAAGPHEVTDVVVGRADGAGDGGLVSGQIAAGVGVGVGAGVGVNQRAVVVHQDQAHGQFLLVHPRYAVDGGDDGRLCQRHGTPVKLGVLAGSGHGQPVGAQGRAEADVRPGRTAAYTPAGCRARGGRRSAGAGRGNAQARRYAAGGCPQVLPPVAHAGSGLGGGEGVEVERAARLAAQDLGVEALGREVGAERGRRVVETTADVRFDIGELRGQTGFHQARLHHCEAGRAAVGRGQLKGEGYGARRAFQRGHSQGGSEGGAVGCDGAVSDQAVGQRRGGQ